MAFAAPELFSTGTQPGLAPAVKLEKGSAGAGAGGFGGDLLSAAAGALGVVQPDPLTDALSSAFVYLVAAPGLSTCRLRFLPSSDLSRLVSRRLAAISRSPRRNSRAALAFWFRIETLCPRQASAARPRAFAPR